MWAVCITPVSIDFRGRKESGAVLAAIERVCFFHIRVGGKESEHGQLDCAGSTMIDRDAYSAQVGARQRDIDLVTCCCYCDNYDEDLIIRKQFEFPSFAELPSHRELADMTVSLTPQPPAGMRVHY